MITFLQFLLQEAATELFVDCPDCGDDPALPGRVGVCDECGGNRDDCDNCQGTGSPICCRCEGTGKITQQDYDTGWH